MKTTFFYLALVAFSFNQTIEAKELNTQDSNQIQEVASLVFEDSLKGSKVPTKKAQILESTKSIDTNDAEIFNPNAVIKTSSERSIEEVVAENVLIIESEQEVYQPIALESTIEDVINENNLIIENNTVDEVYPLDFEKINSSIQNIKLTNKKEAIIFDLKL